MNKFVANFGFRGKGRLFCAGAFVKQMRSDNKYLKLLKEGKTEIKERQ